MFKKIFEPGKIGNLELKNRLIVPAMFTGYAAEDGNLTERYIRYYEEKARGGFGLIVCENNAVEPRGAGFNNLPGLWDGIDLDRHKELVRRVRVHGAKVFVQVYHAGRQASEAILGEQPVAPSAIHDPAIYEIPHELSVDEIVDIEDRFAEAIYRAKGAGYDGVELHGAHGYLINQFVSPFSNRRTDIYGGTLMNRLRFPLNIIRKAYEKTGQDFAITYRISADEFVEGGLTIEDSIIIAGILENAGIKAIHVSGGVYKTGHLVSAPYQGRTAIFADFAARIKEGVDIPVIAVNKINTPFVAESVLKRKKADFVAMGRASIADPSFPLKISEGRVEDIIPCIACDQGCQGKIALQKPVSCLVNPRTGREGIFNLEKVEVPEKVMVIGGGIAGMQAAIVAAARGHRVAIFERSDRLGGQWLLASTPPSKEVFNSLIVYMKTQLDKLGVQVHLNTDVSEDAITRFDPGHVVLSTGATPVHINVPGIERHPNVVQANDILSGNVLPGRHAAIIGGGLVGVETAEHIAIHGSHATVVEMRETHLAEMAGMPKAFLLESLAHNKVDIRLGTALEEITEKSMILRKGALKEEIPVDQIIIAVGSRPDKSLGVCLNGKFKYTIAGDATGVADGIESVKEGYEAAFNI